jgi:hypothetical protein
MLFHLTGWIMHEIHECGYKPMTSEEIQTELYIESSDRCESVRVALDVILRTVKDYTTE